MTKIIIVILLTLALLSGCGSKPAPKASSAPRSTSTASDKEEIFAKNDLYAFLLEKPILCKFKYSGSILSDTKFYISEISDLTYSVTEQPTGSIVRAADITGTFTATGALDKRDGPANKITTEPVHFKASVEKYSNGTTFSKYTVDAQPLTKLNAQPDTNNLLESVNVDTHSSRLSYLVNGRTRELNLSAFNLRAVVINDRSTDEEDLAKIFDVEFYDDKGYICTGKIFIDYTGLDYIGKPRAVISELKQ